jgi:DNA primase
LAAYFSEDKITEIKNQVDILDIVSESVLMKKAGRNYVGLCPFHSEKTPSFSVSPDKQIFYCFGCGEGGNVFSFLMKMEGLSFPETARQLARRYGIDIPSRSLTPAQKQRMSQKERMLAINRIAAEFYQGYLFKNKAGGLARDYFVKSGMSNWGPFDGGSNFGPMNSGSNMGENCQMFIMSNMIYGRFNEAITMIAIQYNN